MTESGGENYPDHEFIFNTVVTRFQSKKIIYLPVTSSTNDIAVREAQAGALEGTIVIAGTQTAGKGRLGRVWTSPEGVLAFSIILRPSLDRVSSLIMVSSLAVLHTIKQITGIQAEIKWPNDVLIRGKKVSGTLIENGWRGNIPEYAVVGIGLNVNFNPDNYPEITGTATSLSRETGKFIPVREVTKQLIIELDQYYFQESVFEEWKANLVTLGKTIRVTSGKTVYSGIAQSVDEHGSLILRQPDGTIVTINVGDVTLR